VIAQLVHQSIKIGNFSSGFCAKRVVYYHIVISQMKSC